MQFQYVKKKKQLTLFDDKEKSSDLERGVSSESDTSESLLNLVDNHCQSEQHSKCIIVPILKS